MQPYQILAAISVAFYAALEYYGVPHKITFWEVLLFAGVQLALGALWTYLGRKK